MLRWLQVVLHKRNRLQLTITPLTIGIILCRPHDQRTKHSSSDSRAFWQQRNNKKVWLILSCCRDTGWRGCRVADVVELPRLSSCRVAEVGCFLKLDPENPQLCEKAKKHRSLFKFEKGFLEVRQSSQVHTVLVSTRWLQAKTCYCRLYQSPFWWTACFWRKYKGFLSLGHHSICQK